MDEPTRHEREALKNARLIVVAEDEATGVFAYVLTAPRNFLHGHQILSGPWGISIQGDCLDIQTVVPGKDIRWYVGASGDCLLSKFYRCNVLDSARIADMLAEELAEVAQETWDATVAKEAREAIESFRADAEHAPKHKVVELLKALESALANVLYIEWCDLPCKYPPHPWFFAVHEAFCREWAKREVPRG